MLICYSLGNANDQARSSLKRELLGYTDKSNNGQYQYEREGLLKGIPHIKPAKGVIIVKDKDCNKVKKLLKKYGAKLKLFEINIKQAMLH